MDQAYLFNTGKNYMSYNFLGSRPEISPQGEAGYRFAVWAPHARKVSVLGNFNGWREDVNNLEPYGETGIWIGFIPGLQQWEPYKYGILKPDNNWVLKADPYARHAETRPNTASKLYDPDDYSWTDAEYMENRLDAYELKPLNIYEVHLGSWRRYEDGAVYNYRDIAPQLADYVLEMGYTAIELMPLSEYPLDASWGYQVSGYYAVTSRYGTPADLKFFVDHMHNKGIHVFLDWVPAHFPRDEFGLARFDGTPLYEYSDPRLGEHDDWGTLVFDYSKAEVRSFLISNAHYWLSEFHFDGLRVDAVSSMLYRDYGRDEYLPNIHGGNENLEAISFFHELNQMIRENFPGAVIMAEESTSFPLITAGVDRGGLGFTHKWNMGWMNDTLFYNSLDHYLRGYHQNAFTFSMMYAFSERYILPFSHDEVVHGKGTLLGRMPGDYWRKFANLRTLYAYQIAHPGAKLNFMGNELAPFTEWRYYEELEWFLLEYPAHSQVQYFVKTLNHFYLDTPALWENDDNWDGFNWVQTDDTENSVFAFMRFNQAKDEAIFVVLNMTPGVLPEYTFTMPVAGEFELVLNSDESRFGGSDYLTGFGDQKLYTTRNEVYEQAIPGDQLEGQGRTTHDTKEDVVFEATQDQTESGGVIATHRQTRKETVIKLDLTIPPLCAMYFRWRKEDKHING